MYLKFKVYHSHPVHIHNHCPGRLSRLLLGQIEPGGNLALRNCKSLTFRSHGRHTSHYEYLNPTYDSILKLSRKSEGRRRPFRISVHSHGQYSEHRHYFQEYSNMACHWHPLPFILSLSLHGKLCIQRSPAQMVCGYVTLRAFVRYLTINIICTPQHSDPDGPHLEDQCFSSHLLPLVD